MGREIERKFLVKGDLCYRNMHGSLYRQGYLCLSKNRTVRIRTVDQRGLIGIKGITKGISRDEYEYEIPFRDADKILYTLCERPLIEKRRYEIEYDGMIWQVDVFLGENKGLVLAEVELENESQQISLPDWIGKEVSEDPRYFNVNLVKNPFTTW